MMQLTLRINLTQVVSNLGYRSAMTVRYPYLTDLIVVLGII